MNAQAANNSVIRLNDFRAAPLRNRTDAPRSSGADRRWPIGYAVLAILGTSIIAWCAIAALVWWLL